MDLFKKRREFLNKNNLILNKLVYMLKIRDNSEKTQKRGGCFLAKNHQNNRKNNKTSNKTTKISIDLAIQIAYLILFVYIIFTPS